jgi:hypothetical protein
LHDLSTPNVAPCENPYPPSCPTSECPSISPASNHSCALYIHPSVLGFPMLLTHDVTLLVHSRRRVNSVHFSFLDPSFPPPSLPAGASPHVNFAIGCFIL